MLSLRNYEELSIIGKGAYGTVFKARDTENDRTVALKQVRVSNTSDEKGVPISTLREITLLKQLDNLSHPNIVRMFDAFQTYSTSPADTSSDLILTIVFEHVEQDLSQFLFNAPSPGLPEVLIKNLMHQLISGVDYLHVNRLVHRDIKPQNILITRNKQVKIADFGLARVYDYNKLVTSVVVTLWYRAPEILLQQAYTTLVDLWSVGTVLAEMYNRRPLFPGKGDIDQLHKILSVIGCPTKKEWPDESTLSWDTFKTYCVIQFDHVVPEICSEGVDLLKRLLVFNPNERYNAHSCLAHPYFKDVEKFIENNNSFKRERSSPSTQNTIFTNQVKSAKKDHSISPINQENIKRPRIAKNTSLLPSQDTVSVNPIKDTTNSPEHCQTKRDALKDKSSTVLSNSQENNENLHDRTNIVTGNKVM